MILKIISDTLHISYMKSLNSSVYFSLTARFSLGIKFALETRFSFCCFFWGGCFCFFSFCLFFVVLGSFVCLCVCFSFHQKEKSFHWSISRIHTIHRWKSRFSYSSYSKYTSRFSNNWNKYQFLNVNFKKKKKITYN